MHRKVFRLFRKNSLVFLWGEIQCLIWITTSKVRMYTFFQTPSRIFLEIWSAKFLCIKYKLFQVCILFVSIASSNNEGLHFETFFSIISTFLHAEFCICNFYTSTCILFLVSVCKFIYKSDVKKSGYFVSPNYPGFYPKNTECQYTFFGRNSEVVRIQFKEFEVDGITPR